MKIQSLLEVKAGRFKSPMIGKRVKINTKGGDRFGSGGDQFGKVGTVTHAERVHTFSQMVPFVIEYRIELDGEEKAVYYRREHVKKVQDVTEGRFYFFIDGDKNGKGPWTVMTSRGDQHDTYETYDEAETAKDKLNKKYGKDDERGKTLVSDEISH